MAKWVRVHINSSSDTFTNAYVDLEQYGFVRIEYDNNTSVWRIVASTVENTQTTNLFGSWATQELASRALYALLVDSSDLSKY